MLGVERIVSGLPRIPNIRGPFSAIIPGRSAQFQIAYSAGVDFALSPKKSFMDKMIDFFMMTKSDALAGSPFVQGYKEGLHLLI